MSLMSPRMVQRMSSTAVTAAAVGQRHQRAVTTPSSDPPRAASTPQAMHRGQLGVAELSPVLRVHRRVDHPEHVDVAGAQQRESGRHQAGQAEGEGAPRLRHRRRVQHLARAAGAAGDPVHGDEPTEAEQEGPACIGQSRFDSVPCTGAE